MKKVKKILIDNKKIIIFYIIFFIAMIWEFPYYIEAPGGIINVDDRIDIINNYNSNGSFNLAYVSEYGATIPTLLYSVFNKDWKVYKKADLLEEDQSYSDYQMVDRLLLEEAYSNAIYYGYSKAEKNLSIKSEKIYVSYVFEETDTDIEMGDQIIEVDGKVVNSKEEIDEIVRSYNVSDKIKIKVLKGKEEKERYAKLIEYENTPVVGLSVIKIRELETDPLIKINYKAKETGPSGGLMLALDIYNNLVSEDITHGLTIVGTGTIDLDGNVGSIGGVEYKLAAAEKNNADIFIVPNGDNYKDAIKLKKKKNYNIEIVGVSTFDEALEYLKNRE